MSPFLRLRPLLRVALPVAVASTLVCLAVVNMALVKAWKGEPEDGVLWGTGGRERRGRSRLPIPARGAVRVWRLATCC
jgi:hypothetical protein